VDSVKTIVHLQDSGENHSGFCKNHTGTRVVHLLSRIKNPKALSAVVKSVEGRVAARQTEPACYRQEENRVPQIPPAICSHPSRRQMQTYITYIHIAALTQKKRTKRNPSATRQSNPLLHALLRIRRQSKLRQSNTIKGALRDQ